ncbi:SLC13 family permease [Halorubellus sp. JP-L1]|uniref:SLC13 family permease n=1 Tax=Halorubellus sp. JP-L1 TaxID=2715753 RepID=UPI0014075E0A|nr:SLC13 family permease [Halorubellus sp. JP-L1]NHN42797.1 SLC13 family permease [Halorubellus sp. JP-L1]
MAVPPMSTEMLVVFGLIGAALVLFVTELVPSDMTAIGVLVSLVVLESWTGVGARDAISGFASSATITIVAMYILSAGIQKTGLVERLGVYLARFTNGSESRLLGATVGSTGVSAGIINNTPVVAVFIPMITGLAERSGISPSKLLLPLSYAAMLGGTLTLIGTSTNILASDLSRELLGQPLSMFEFTKLGVVVLAVGSLYLLTVGRRLTPARIDPIADFTEEFGLEDHLTRLRVRESSPLTGLALADADAEIDVGADADLDILQLERGTETFLASGSDQTVEAGDVLTVRANTQIATHVASQYDLQHQPRAAVTELELTAEDDAGTLAEVVILPESRFVGETVLDTKLAELFETTTLAVRRGDALYRDGLDERELRSGDVLLLQTTPGAIEYLSERGDVVVTEAAEEPLVSEDEPAEAIAPLSSHTPIAAGIMLAVIGVAALDVLPIVIAALGGVVAMVITDCIDTNEAYDAVSWNIIFLLAGVIPLGLAMQRTGGDEFIAAVLVQSASVLPVIAVLALFYLLTGLLANVITPVASVVLMIPIAVDTAERIGANGLAFLLAVMFAGSAAFMTPIGYQTNLMVYGPGGYRFTDYLRVGGPLQVLTATVTTLGIAYFWGVT